MPTVRELFACYLKHARINGTLTPAAFTQRERTLAVFAGRYGDTAVADLRPFHLTDLIADHPGWKATGTRRRVAAEIKAVFAWAVDEERIERHPFRRVRYAPSERRPEIPDDVLARLIAAAGPIFAPVLRFLRLTGCRIGELCEAKWGDVDLERGVWTVHRHKGRKATGKPKIVVLVGVAIEVLREKLAAAAVFNQTNIFDPADSVIRKTVPTDADFVFLNSRGTPMTPDLCRQRLQRLKRRLRIVGYSIHSIRHAFATRAVAAGAPIKLVSIALGHRSVSTTERFYVSVESDLPAIRAAALAAMPRLDAR